MTRIQTFYWHDRIKGRFNLLLRRHALRRESAWRDFAVGNAGDIFARNVIALQYNEAQILNTKAGPRLLCIGSVAHQLRPGDVVCGVGSKGVPLPDIDPGSVMLHALRGPLTQQELKAAGYDTSTVRWFGDPGLLLSQLLAPAAPKPGRVIFIPHYRERHLVKHLVPKGIQTVDIDADPLAVGRAILAAELVYASSLHGIIFAHALNRPVVMVRPATPEPLSKFEDYHLGVGLDMPTALTSIAEAEFKTAPNSPATLSMRPEDMSFPDTEVLQGRGILKRSSVNLQHQYTATPSALS